VMKVATLKKKLAKAAHPGCCSNGYCHRTPTPGMKTCEACRGAWRRYRVKCRSGRPDPYKRDVSGRFARAS
jgi:hypothetical protein